MAGLVRFRFDTGPLQFNLEVVRDMEACIHYDDPRTCVNCNAEYYRALPSQNVTLHQALTATEAERDVLKKRVEALTEALNVIANRSRRAFKDNPDQCDYANLEHFAVTALAQPTEPASPEPIPAYNSHAYLSTACFHKQHEDCRTSCKFCFQGCSCSCHQEPAS
jgi:hypothetical protein